MCTPVTRHSKKKKRQKSASSNRQSSIDSAQQPHPRHVPVRVQHMAPLPLPSPPPPQLSQNDPPAAPASGTRRLEFTDQISPKHGAHNEGSPEPHGTTPHDDKFYSRPSRAGNSTEHLPTGTPFATACRPTRGRPRSLAHPTRAPAATIPGMMRLARGGC